MCIKASINIVMVTLQIDSILKRSKSFTWGNLVEVRKGSITKWVLIVGHWLLRRTFSWRETCPIILSFWRIELIFSIWQLIKNNLLVWLVKIQLIWTVLWVDSFIYAHWRIYWLVCKAKVTQGYLSKSVTILFHRKWFLRALLNIGLEYFLALFIRYLLTKFENYFVFILFWCKIIIILLLLILELITVDLFYFVGWVFFKQLLIIAGFPIFKVWCLYFLTLVWADFER